MSTIYLYQNCKIDETKNFIVENIESYLNTLTKATYANMQYIKNANNIDVEIKINISQDALNITNKYNYCKIVNSSSTFYYFIRNIEWCSVSAIRVVLRLDSLNSFNGKYALNEKTKILRQHMDRFKRNPAKKYALGGSSKVLINNVLYGLKSPDALVIYNQSIANNGSGHIYIFDYSMNIIKQYDVNNFKIDFLNSQKRYVIYNNNVVLDQVAYGEAIIGFIANNGTYSTQQSPFTHVHFITTSNVYLRNIDINGESITAPLYGEDKDELNTDNTNYYLIYKTDNDFDADNPDAFVYNNAVSVYCCADNEIEGETFTNKAEINPAMLEENKFYLIKTHRYKNEWKYTTTGEGFKFMCANTTAEIELVNAVSHDITIFKKTGNLIEYWVKEYNVLGVNVRISKHGTTSKFTFDNDEQYHKISIDSGTYGEIINSINETYNITATGSVTYNVLTIDRINRTDSKLIKIFMIPYKPVKEFNEFVYTNEQLYKLDVNTEGFINNLEFTPEFNPFESLTCEINPLRSDSKNINYESKLFHSDFYLPKFVYDSFAFGFYLECAEPFATTKFDVEFITSNTCNSRFAFRFPQYNTTKKTRQDYNVLTISRNNEIAIFNNYYLNYLRNGYNYDVKNKARSEIATGVGVATALGTLALGIASNNPALIATGAISSTTGLINAINSIASQEQSLQQKINQMKEQSASMSGSDDVDIMKAITNNKAKLMLYKVSDNMKNALYDLFYYTGYVCNYNAKPDFNSRTWFNFVQCNPVFDIDTMSVYINNDIKNDLINRYNEGVTLLHKVENAWDFEQLKENYESWIFE